MSFFSEHIPQLFIVAGLAMLAIEIGLLGFSTFVLFFVGLATLISGGLMYIGVLDETLLQGVAATAVLSSLLAALLWKPLKALQKDVQISPVKQDFVGEQFRLSTAVSPEQDGSEKFSGIQWVVRSRVAIPANTLVRVTAVSVGVLDVEPCA